jgi:hypothetical protein
MELALSALAAGAGEIGAGAAAAGAAGIAEAGAGAAAVGAGAAGAGAAAGGGSLLAALGSSPVTSILSGASTAVSVLMKLNAGEINAKQAEFKATEAQNEAIGEQATQAQRATAIKRSLLKTLGENDVAYAASGIDTSYGEAATTRDRATDRAYSDIAVDQATSGARVAGYDARSAAYNRMARSYRTGSLLDAFAPAGHGAAQAGRRGVA